MGASQQLRLEAVETKTDMLENVLAQFISSTNLLVLRLEADTRKFKEEIRSDTKKMKNEMKDLKGEMKDFKDEMKDFKDEMKDFKDEMKDFKDEMKDFKDEMKDFKDEMKDFKEETRRANKEMNKRWGELSNKMGTLVEDMVAPNISSIARDYFNDDDFKSFGVRVLRRNEKDRAIRREFDVIAETDEIFIVNETKSKPRPEDPNAFSKLLESVPDFFPGARGKRMIPIFSSLYIPEVIQKKLTRRGIYAMGMKEGTMDLLNFRDVAGPEIKPPNSTG